MNKFNHFLIFYLDDKKYALDISVVEKVFRVVEITTFPRGPEFFLGVVNIQGLITPVINIREKLGLPDREINLTDLLIVVNTVDRPLALLVDRVDGIVRISEKEITGKDEILPGIKYISGVMKFEGEILLIHNLDEFLSIKDRIVLEEIIGEVIA